MGGANSAPQIKYSIEVPGSEKPGSSAIYRHPNAKEHLDSKLSSGAKTLYEAHVISAQKFATCIHLGTRMTVDGKPGEYIWKVYAEVRDYAQRVGFGLHHLGITERDEDDHSFLGIYSKNREEWVITDFACITQNITSVPLYDTQQQESISLIVEQTRMKGIVCAAKLTSNLIKLKIGGFAHSLNIIIQFEDVDENTRNEAKAAGLDVYSLKEVSQLVQEGGKEHPPTPDSWFTICYTSGTTGKSKGAIITHQNMISTIAGGQELIQVTHDDSYLSYLPLAHMLERAVTHLFSIAGSGIGFYSGDIMKLKEDLAELKPTIFVSVPRLFSRFYDVINQMFSGAKGLKGCLVKKAVKAKEEAYNTTGELTHSFWDKIVFNKVKAIFGGRVRLMITGSAPISGEILAFLRIAFCCPILEGYGQTESCAGTTLTHPKDNQIGILGGPFPTVELKLVDVPDMNYLVTDKDEQNRPIPRGEICFRGPTVFAGYYKAPDLTAEAVDSEGWLHSGDVGVVYPSNGAFKIIDRKKNFFKLSQGEYVAAEKIEIAYNKSYLISQIFVYGDSYQSYLVAVIVPDELYIRKEWLPSSDLSQQASFEEICGHPKLKEAIIADMTAKGKEAKLLGFEVVKKIHIEHQAWTTEDLLTPTQKLMRFQAKKKYQDIIDQLYREPL